jgi:hypothetical protein
VRERLRAAGVDPDELQKMMESNRAGTGQASGAGAGLPDAAAPAASAQFAPVTPVAGQPPAFADSAAEAAAAPAPEDSAGLRPFGYDIFSLPPATFEPLTFGPVAPDYLIGPGDEVIVSVWGSQELNSRAVVNREGFIVLPDVGQVAANGLTLSQFKDSLEKRLARIYSGISRDGRGRTSVDVTLGKLRSIQVFRARRCQTTRRLHAECHLDRDERSLLRRWSHRQGFAAQCARHARQPGHPQGRSLRVPDAW